MPELQHLARTSRLNQQFFRYVLNGIVATLVHFGVLILNIEVFDWKSAGLSNLVASVFGIATSFVGSRYFVFAGSAVGVKTQLWRFLTLYALLAAMHGLFMYVWTDRFEFNYLIGFVLATGIQVLSSYFGNKLVVFKV
jgi:putative flippase GtrA